MATSMMTVTSWARAKILPSSRYYVIDSNYKSNGDNKMSINKCDDNHDDNNINNDNNIKNDDFM